MENFKDLLTITPVEDKNVVKIDAKWDYCDGNYTNKHESLNANDFFKDKKLIMSLAYLDIYGEYIEDNGDIDFDALSNVVKWEHNLWGYGVDISAHSLVELGITYYDENGNQFNVTFDNIHKRWETMSEEEICKEVNDVLLNND